MRHIAKGFYSIGIAVILMLFVGVYSEYRYFLGVLEERTKITSQLECALVTEQISGKLNLKGQIVSDAAAFISNETDDKRVLVYLQSLLNSDSSFRSIYYGTVDNHMVNASGWVPPAEFDLRTRPWYKKAMENQHLVFTEAFLNASKDSMIITVAVPVKDRDGKILGVVAGDVSLDGILRLVNEIEESDTAFTMLLDGKDNVLASTELGHFPPEEINHISAVSQPAAQVFANFQEGISRITDKGEEGYLSIHRVPDTEWRVGSFVTVSKLMDDQIAVVRFFAMLLGASALVLMLMLYVQRKYIIQPVLALDNDIQDISVDEDLVHRLDTHKKDPFVTIRHSINHMLDRAHQLFVQKEESLSKLMAAEETLRLQHADLLKGKEALSISEERYRAIVSAMPDIIFQLDGAGNFTDCSVSDESQLIMPREMFIGKNLRDVMPPEIAHKGLEVIDQALTSGMLSSFEYSLDTANGKMHYELRVSTVRPGEVIAISRNITEQKINRLHIEYLSYHDQLTGLYNRRFFEEELRRLDTERNLPFTLAMADVNGLKLTNDAFGHIAGDNLLIRVSEIIAGECRADDIVARIGGDEFVILFPQTSAADAENILKRITTAVMNEQTEKIVLSVSIGNATKTDAAQAMNDVFAKAEENMYRKKLAESQSMRHETVQVILKTLNEKSAREKGHSERVGAACRAIGEAMGLDAQDLHELETAGFMHDIGKIAISESLLNRTGDMTEDEMDEIKKHAEVGYQIMKSVDAYSSMAEYILSHHERWDGSGYPRKLKGSEIPLFSRIIAVAEAYDTMTEYQPYRTGMSKSEAMAEIKRVAGVQFDAEVVSIFEGIMA